MSCTFTWYNLPNQINKIIKPFTTTKVLWYNLPNTLDKVYKELLLLKPICPQAPKFQWFSLNQKAEAICDLVTCISAVPQYNFDVTSTDWGSIVDANSFKIYLEGRNFETTNTVTNFSLVGGRLRCSISNIISLYLNSLNITEVNYVTIVGLVELNLRDNQIVNFNPTIALPTGLLGLYLHDNQIVNFNPTIALPAGLILLYLQDNQIVNFNPTITLPTGLRALNLNNNQIVNFNPTIALPTGLRRLYLQDNQIVNFNPTIALPTGLIGLYLHDNQIVNFNPTIALPTGLLELYLSNNQMTLLGYTSSEVWANSLTISVGKSISLDGNIDSSWGTNFATILTSKGWGVYS